MKSFSDEEKSFSLRHPELAPFIPHMVGVFRSCQADKLRGERVPLEQMYDHVVTECKRCSAAFRRLVESQKRFFS